LREKTKKKEEIRKNPTQKKHKVQTYICACQKMAARDLRKKGD
jgi:hypothetical protein